MPRQARTRYQDPCGFYTRIDLKKGEVSGSCRRCGQYAVQGCLTDNPAELTKTAGKLWCDTRAECYTEQAREYVRAQRAARK